MSKIEKVLKEINDLWLFHAMTQEIRESLKTVKLKKNAG